MIWFVQAMSNKGKMFCKFEQEHWFLAGGAACVKLLSQEHIKSCFTTDFIRYSPKCSSLSLTGHNFHQALCSVKIHTYTSSLAFLFFSVSVSSVRNCTQRHPCTCTHSHLSVKNTPFHSLLQQTIPSIMDGLWWRAYDGARCKPKAHVHTHKHTSELWVI